MARIEKIIYKCDRCEVEYDTDEGMIWICEITKIDGEQKGKLFEDLLFCDKTCLKKWIDEVL